MFSNQNRELRNNVIEIAVFYDSFDVEVRLSNVWE